MTKLNLDLRFVEYNYDLILLGEFINLIEENIKEEIKKKEKEIDDKIKQFELNINDPEYQIFSNEEIDFREHFLPKHFRNPIVVTLWAVIETCIIAIAEYIRNEENKILKLRDIRADNFLKQSKKYFMHVLEYPIIADDQVYERFTLIMKFRHLIAHCNGRFSNLKSQNDIDYLLSACKQNTGIDVINDELTASEKFVRESYETVKNELQGLIKKIQDKY